MVRGRSLQTWPNPFGLGEIPLDSCAQFLATLKIMDYSLLVGIHDVERAEQEEMDVEGTGEEEEYENDGMGGGALTGSFGTPPDSPGNPLNCGGFFGPGEFDPSVDVYAIKSRDGERRQSVPRNPAPSSQEGGVPKVIKAELPFWFQVL